MRKIAALVLLLALAACSGGDDTDQSTEPTPGFEVPAGVTVSPAGTSKTFGESMAVPYPAATDETGTALTLGVAGLNRAPRSDLALFTIPDGMQPYYLRIQMGNRGPGDASFPEGLPWWLHVTGDVLVPATAAPAGFSPCPAPKVAEPFPVGQSAKGCLLFFVPEGTEIESVDFQPGDVTTAVRWTP